jgi:hypothetical protein
VAGSSIELTRAEKIAQVERSMVGDNKPVNSDFLVAVVPDIGKWSVFIRISRAQHMFAKKFLNHT